jgi:hypothetical protein
MLKQGTVVTLSHYPLRTHGKSSHCELDGRLGGSESWSQLFRQEEILCFCHDLNPSSSSVYSSLVGILTAIFWLLYIVIYKKFLEIKFGCAFDEACLKIIQWFIQ